jgi:hypothetical protein
LSFFCHSFVILLSFFCHSFASSTATMVELCRESLLSEDDIMALTDTLFAPTTADGIAATGNADRMVYSSILLGKRGQDRVLAHNWWVGKFLGEPFLLENGPKIERLRFPLFPPVPQFEGINTRLLLTVTGMSGGGSSDPTAAEMQLAGAAFYAPRSSATAPRGARRSATAQGGALPFPVVDSSGSPAPNAYVDMQAVADAVNGLRADTARLEQRISLVEGVRPAFGPAVTEPTRGRRGGRGRGERSRARGRAFAAGEDEPGEKPTQSNF